MSSPGSATGDDCFGRLVGRALDCRAGSRWFDSRGRTNGHGSQNNSEIGSIYCLCLVVRDHVEMAFSYQYFVPNTLTGDFVPFSDKLRTTK